MFIIIIIIYVEQQLLPIHVQVYDVSYYVLDHLCIIMLVYNYTELLNINTISTGRGL